MLLYAFPALVTFFPDIAFIIEAMLATTKNSSSYPFPITVVSMRNT